MANLTITEAARQWRLSRQTVYNKIQSGELSASEDVSGAKVIDTSEMLRVFGEPKSAGTEAHTATPDQPISLLQQLEIERIKREHAEHLKQVLTEQVQSLQAKIERLEQKEDVRDKREEERERRLLLAIEAVSKKELPAPPQPEKRSFLGKIFGL